MRRTYRSNCNRLTIAAALVLEVGATTLVNRSLFHDATAHPKSDGATVRISALKSESGAVLAWILVVVLAGTLVACNGDGSVPDPITNVNGDLIHCTIRDGEAIVVRDRDGDQFLARTMFTYNSKEIRWRAECLAAAERHYEVLGDAQDVLDRTAPRTISTFDDPGSGEWKCVELPGEETYRRWIYYPGNELDDFDPATTTFAQRVLRGQREPTDQMLGMISTSLNRSDISPSFIAWVEGCHAE